eukprot:TRINITY_DN26328_c0_g1_i1.p1 TRINITY_DN26328_c0_g1~~TRINITY_DN26328_c0_g1_i1.p1  ORF type:complete len:968 (+),score=390.57 TRINITY_DN26328_c0_g1_i1:48-2951(+)
MDIGLVACVHSPPKPIGGKAITVCENGLDFTTPDELKDAGFPHSQARFAFDNVHVNPQAKELFDQHMKGVGAEVLNRQNAVIYFGGKRATPKRELLFGTPSKTSSSIMHMVLEGLAKHPEFKNHTYKATCYTLGAGKDITDLLKLDNDGGCVLESLKGPPVISGVTEESITNWTGLQKVCQTVAENYTTIFKDVIQLPDPKESFPAYQPDNIIFSLKVYPINQSPAETEDGTFEQMSTDIEQNSVTLIALGDSERPALCGIEQKTLAGYEDQQKTLSAVVGVLGAIRCKRLRVPFGKCRLMHLLKRAYNSEKNNPHNEDNKPTFSLMVLNVLEDGRNAEESYHSLVFAKRIVNVIGGSGVGPASRDLAIERWRLEQDIVELKDELEIVKIVHGYKPCIYNQSKPVQNIKEEEKKRIDVILKKRENDRNIELEATRAKAAEEAKSFIDGEQKKSNQNIQKLEKLLDEKTHENQKLNDMRDKKIKEYEKQLEKVRKKRQDEEEKTEKLRKDIVEIEAQLAARQESIAQQKQQLELLSKDHSKGRELILQGRLEAKSKREKVEGERQDQRRKWLAEIKQMNDKVLASVKELDALRKSKTGKPADENEDTEATIKDEIKSVDRFLSQLISVEEPHVKDDKTETIRKQLYEYFDTERKRCEARLAQELDKRDQLDKAAASYKTQINEQQNRVKKDQMADAVKKEKHLESLLEQVVQYLEHGCRMVKIRGGERKRYLYISDDRRRIHSCEIDEDGAPANKKRPTTTAYFKDIKKITLGQFTPNFKNFEGSKGMTRPADLIHDVDGAYNRTPTATVTPENLGHYFYRSFSLEFKKGKTWDVIAETDSDFEAWVVVLQRLLCNKDEWKKLSDPRKGGGNDPPPTMSWGEPLDISGRQGADRLMAEEAKLCAENHITPIQYINIKAQIIHKAQLGFVTVYDVRTLSTLDLLRSRVVHDFFIAKKVIPQPNPVDIRS